MADKNIEVLLKDVRLSFADIYEPKERTDDDGNVTGYQLSASLLVRKDDPQVEALKKVMKDAIEATWPGQDKKIPADRRCVRDGEPKDEDSGERYAKYEGYAGCFYVSANKGLKATTREDAVAEVWAKNPVQILGPRKGPDGTFPILSPGHPDFPYSGCYVDAIVRIYGYDGTKAKGARKHPDRVNASLEAIKFKRHGDAFGSKPVDAQSKFEEEPADDLEQTKAPAGAGFDDDDIG